MEENHSHRNFSGRPGYVWDGRWIPLSNQKDNNAPVAPKESPAEAAARHFGETKRKA